MYIEVALDYNMKRNFIVCGINFILNRVGSLICVRNMSGLLEVHLLTCFSIVNTLKNWPAI